MVAAKVLSYIFVFGLGAAVSAFYWKEVVAKLKSDVELLDDEAQDYYHKWNAALSALPAKIKKKL